MSDRHEQVELLAARLHEVKTGDPDSYSKLPPDERRSWRSMARRVLGELIQLPEASRGPGSPPENHPASQGEEREPDVEDAYCVEEFLRKVLSWEGSDEDELAEAIQAAEKLVGALDTAPPDSNQKGQS